MREVRAQSRRSLTRPRVIAIGVIAISVLLITRIFDSESWLEGLELLVLPGGVWMLWVAAGLAADQREDRTEMWRWQSGRKPWMLALEGTLGAAAPGFALIVIGLVGTLHSDSPRQTFALAMWCVAAALSLVAIGRWRRTAEPRARHGWRGRFVVMACVVGVLALSFVGDAPWSSGAVRSMFESIPSRDAYSLWAMGGALGACAIALWAAGRAECGVRDVPRAYIAAVVAAGLWMSAIPDGAGFNPAMLGVGWLGVAAIAAATPLLQPWAAQPGREDPVRWAAALTGAWTLLACIGLMVSTGESSSAVEDTAAMGVAIGGAYLVRDLAMFELLRKWSPGERHPTLMWIAWVVVAWGAFALVSESTGLPAWLVMFVCLPWPHGLEALESLQWEILVCAVVEAGALWGVLIARARRARAAGAMSNDDGLDLSRTLEKVAIIAD